MIDRGRIDEPTSCPNCKNKFCMEMVHNRSLFSDKQMVRLQETPDDIPEGETPQAVTLFGFQDLVRTQKSEGRLMSSVIQTWILYIVVIICAPMFCCILSLPWFLSLSRNLLRPQTTVVTGGLRAAR